MKCTKNREQNDNFTESPTDYDMIKEVRLIDKSCHKGLQLPLSQHVTLLNISPHKLSPLMKASWSWRLCCDCVGLFLLLFLAVVYATYAALLLCFYMFFLFSDMEIKIAAVSYNPKHDWRRIVVKAIHALSALWNNLHVLIAYRDGKGVQNGTGVIFKANCVDFKQSLCVRALGELIASKTSFTAPWELSEVSVVFTDCFLAWCSCYSLHRALN